jgi:hypothetical protein
MQTQFQILHARPDRADFPYARWTALTILDDLPVATLHYDWSRKAWLCTPAPRVVLTYLALTELLHFMTQLPT